MNWTDQLDVLVAMATAMALGGAIGLERELHNRPAGFRTHMLVAGAAALLLGIGQLSLDIVAAGNGNIRMQSDHLRLLEAVIAGVSFIGAGTIFAHRRGHPVSGITTAATLLMVAVIGAAAGLRLYLLAAAATTLTLVVLILLRWIEKHLGRLRDPPSP